jgi:hypothetical protein
MTAALAGFRTRFLLVLIFKAAPKKNKSILNYFIPAVSSAIVNLPMHW